MVTEWLLYIYNIYIYNIYIIYINNSTYDYVTICYYMLLHVTICYYMLLYVTIWLCYSWLLNCKPNLTTSPVWIPRMKPFSAIRFFATTRSSETLETHVSTASSCDSGQGAAVSGWFTATTFSAESSECENHSDHHFWINFLVVLHQQRLLLEFHMVFAS
jgi:hypothetical protein